MARSAMGKEAHSNISHEACVLHEISNMLWENGQYGASLHRMEQWLKNKPEPSLFENINNEIDKVDFLLEERQRTNNGAYFDPVEESTPLATPVELLEKVDIVIKTTP